MRKEIKAILKQSAIVKTSTGKTQAGNVAQSAKYMIRSLKRGGKVILFGNGGSAADAQHIAAELVGRFQMERKGLPAIALTANSSNMTSIANDYGYEMTFARQVEALAVKRDVVIGISTSGNALNVLKGLQKAAEIGCKTVALTGGSGGLVRDAADVVITVPSEVPARVQETHIAIGHIICELVENALSADKSVEKI